LTHRTDAKKTDDLAESCDRESGSTETIDPRKKKFIEPELSAPISVAEATKFFQGTTSGVLP